MTNPPNDERREAFEKWAADNSHPTTIRDDGTDRYVSTLTALRWQGWQAALSHQGAVVKVSDLRALSASWDERADGMEAKGLGDALGSLGNIRTGLVSAYNSSSEDLTALISKAEKV